MENKSCPKCNEEKPLTDFYLRKADNKPSSYCKTCSRIVRKEWLQSNEGKRQEYYYKYLDKEKEQSKRSHIKLKEETFAAYGGKCECCGVTNREFLTIDHVNNDGEWHRKQLVPNSARGGNARDVMRDLKKRGFPQEGFRLLCFNCHFSRGYSGYCPHQIENSKCEEGINETAQL